MNITENWYWQWDNAVSSEFCDLVVAEADWSTVSEGTVSNVEGTYTPDKNYRSTEIVWEIPMTPIGAVLQTYINAANQFAGWNFRISHMENVQIGRYSSDKSGFYDWHHDMDMPKDGNQRKLTAVMLLSDPKDYEGGRLEIKNIDPSRLLPAKGSIVVFPSYMLHRVTTVTKGIRYTAVAWMRGPTLV